MLSFRDSNVRVTDKKDQASVIDVIRFTANKDINLATKTLSRLRATCPEIDAQIHMYKFPNSVKLTPVASAPVLVQIIWALPGKAARDIRIKCANDICRLLGADPSIIKEVELRNIRTSSDEKNFFLAHTKRPHVESTLDEDAIILKKRKLEVENMELDVEQRRRCMIQQSIQQSIQIYEKTMDIFKNDAHMLSLGRDLVIQSYNGKTSSADKPFPYCPDFSELLKEMGHTPTPRLLSSLGKFIAKEYREAFGKEPPTIPKYVAGANRLVKTYPIEHEEWLKCQISKFVSGNFVCTK